MWAEPPLWRRGFAPEQRAAVAELYWQAFGGKLARVLGPRQRAVAYLQRVIRADHCLSVSDGQGRLLGVAGFKTPRGGFAGGDRASMRAIYGFWGAYWRETLLMWLSASVDNHRFLVDGIAVLPEARGQGLGRQLVAALCQEALARGYGEIRLEVVDSNPRAKALYERLGFRVIAIENIGLLRWIFGFRQAFVMVKALK